MPVYGCSISIRIWGEARGFHGGEQVDFNHLLKLNSDVENIAVSAQFLSWTVLQMMDSFSKCIRMVVEDLWSNLLLLGVFHLRVYVYCAMTDKLVQGPFLNAPLNWVASYNVEITL